MQAQSMANADAMTEAGDASPAPEMQEPAFPPLWQVVLRGLFSLLSLAALVNPGLNWAAGPGDQRSQPGRYDRADPSPPHSPRSSPPSSLESSLGSSLAAPPG